jgi:hypothetical protein
MKCNICGADSQVLATRKFQNVFLKRKRRCSNNHPFTTYEVFPGNLDRRTLADTRRGIETRIKVIAIRHTVLKEPTRSATSLAVKLNITEARVRQIRKQHEVQHQQVTVCANDEVDTAQDRFS